MTRSRIASTRHTWRRPVLPLSDETATELGRLEVTRMNELSVVEFVVSPDETLVTRLTPAGSSPAQS